MDKKAFDALVRARSSLILGQPFFGALSLRLKLVEDKTIPTANINGKVMRYNPKFVTDLPAAQLKTLVGHEVGHCVFGHPARAYGRNPRKWNMACDYVVNEMLDDAGFDAIPTWLRDKAYNGMTADQIYNLIPEDPQDGSGGTGKPGGALCDIEDGSGAAPHDIQQSEADARDWQVAAIQSAQAAKMRGKLPANLERLIDGMFAPKVNWKKVLRRFVSAKAKGDYTFSRPNRRYIPHDIFLPTLYSESMGEMVVGVDVSGSIDDETLKAFGSEVSSIVADAKPERVHVVYCDSQVAHVDVFERDDPVVLKPHGGGGTDLREIFEYIKEKALEPVCAVVLTDGYTPFNDVPPPYPSLWVITTDVVAPFGETLPIEL